jgi:hypothetical protein
MPACCVLPSHRCSSMSAASFAPGQPVRHVYFVESGLVSIVGANKGRRRMEVGMVGFEGMTTLETVLGRRCRGARGPGAIARFCVAPVVPPARRERSRRPWDLGQVEVPEPRRVRGRGLDRSRGQQVALLLGYYTDDGRLHYAGRAGTGMTEKELKRLAGVLAPLKVPKMPLAKPPPRDSRFGSPLKLSRVHWVQQCGRPLPSAPPPRSARH